MLSPGISIKPYPSGVLTHPSMDALLFLLRETGIGAEDIERVTLRAGRNVLGPIRYRIARTELEGKFRSEEHTSELQSLMRISYDVLCLKKKTTIQISS